MKSYLAWPIIFVDRLGVVEEAHVTLKYFGSTPVTVNELKTRFLGCLLRLEIDWRVSWTPNVFFKSRVMVLSNLDDRLLITKSAVDALRKDDYPEWRPHITLSKEVWGPLARTPVEPWQAIRETGPLTLFVDGSPVHTFE